MLNVCMGNVCVSALERALRLWDGGFTGNQSIEADGSERRADVCFMGVTLVSLELSKKKIFF